MKTIYYSQLDNPTLDIIKTDIEQENPNRIVFFCETEWEYQDLNQDLADLVNKNNIQVVITFCSYPSDFYNERAQFFNDIKIVHWPTYWLNWTMMCSNMLNFDVEYKEFKYPFICLNNKNHSHRCALIDELARNNLLDKGIVTWHRFPREQSSKFNYEFKYYDDSLRFIDDDFHTILDSFLIPKQYHESFLHVVGEATLKVTCISEKTWLPILYKKPFVIMGIEGINQKLKELGFELYDEIIDYSFDSEPDMQKRAHAISENVKRISEQNVNDLYQLVKEKTIRNYNNYMRVLHDASYVPDIMKERILDIYHNPNTKMTYTDPRYLHIGRDTKIIC